MECLFCKIGAQEIPSKEVYESRHAFAFLDINPLSDGHSVVIPKTHAVDITELPDAEIGPLFLAVKEVILLLKSKLDIEHFTIGINHGEVAGQVVPHLHIHIIPRNAQDGGESLHGVIKNSNKKKSLEIIHKKIIS